jgi:hypothetical protein
MLRSIWVRGAAAVALAVAIGACAGGPTVEETPLERVQQAVHDAQRTGAADEPLAAFHLRLARQQLGRARLAEQTGDHREANAWLARAEADARLALSRARASKLRRRDLRAHQELERLRREERKLAREPHLFDERGTP